MKIFSCKTLLLAFFLVFIIACSTKKNTFVARNYHALTERYNVLYNGNIALNKGVLGIQQVSGDNFWERLPIERMLPLLKSGEESPKNADFDLAETKATKAIQKHSMNIGGREVNYQTDEAYLLLGKSRYYDQRFVPALDAFNYILYKYPESDKIYEAKVWREKTNMRMGNDALVIKNIHKLLKTEEFKDQPLADAHALMAEAFLNLKFKDSAITQLKVAEHYTKNNEQKARYRFILGQLYQEIGKKDSASYFYDAVIAMHRKAKRDYVIHSYARKAQMFDYTNDDPEAFIAVYDELIADRENRPFLDIIYYNMGIFYDNYRQDEEAKNFYKASLKTQPKDPYLVAFNYRNLGNLYFRLTNYPTAAKYYDSTLVHLDPKSREFYKIAKKRKNLDEVIRLEDITHRNDSILKIIQLNPEARTTYFTEYITTLKQRDSIRNAKEELEKQKLANIQRNSSAAATPDIGAPTGIGVPASNGIIPPSDIPKTDGSTFYFYNPNTVAYGKQQFRRAFGKRTLVDNWLYTSVGKNLQNTLEPTEENNIVPEKIASERPDYTVAYYLNSLPTEAAAIDSIAKERNTAYYQLGVVYKEKLKEYNLATDKLEQLRTFQPEPTLIPPTLYHLYKIYETSKPERAQTIKENLLATAPDSRYARLLTLKDSDVSLEKDAPETIYQECYQSYLQEKFPEVIQQCNQMIQQLTGEELVSKFELLKAFAIAKLQGLPAYKSAIQYVADNYPSAEEGKKAEKILAEEIPVLERMAFSNEDTKNWKILFSIPADDYQQERAIEQELIAFSKKENLAKLYYTCDNYTDKERIICWHGFPSEVYAKDIASQLNTKWQTQNRAKAIPITDKNYAILQITKNWDQYLATQN